MQPSVMMVRSLSSSTTGPTGELVVGGDDAGEVVDLLDELLSASLPWTVAIGRPAASSSAE
jgi:hypothetical protein